MKGNNTRKQHLVDRRPRFPPIPETRQQLLTSFLAAVQSGEMTTLTSLLSENVTMWTDGGGKTRSAALRPIIGRDAVARMSLGTKRFWPENTRFELKEVNGQATLIMLADGQAFAVLSIDVEQDHIQTIHIIANPEKLM